MYQTKLTPILVPSFTLKQVGHCPGNQRKVRESEKGLKSQEKVREFEGKKEIQRKVRNLNRLFKRKSFTIP